MYDQFTGEKISNSQLVKTPLKMFGMVKRNLEFQGFKITIIYHPKGEYPQQIVMESPMEEKKRELDEAKKRIAELEAQLAKTEEENKPKAVKPKKDIKK